MVHFTQGKHASLEVRSVSIDFLSRVIVFKYSETSSTNLFRPWLEFCEGATKHCQHINIFKASDVL